ncbi:MAG: restriction endonuclease subunit S [Acidobacteriaceae bacterium]
MSLPRYPKYKDSGVEWLGKVPEHWEVYALKRIANLQSGDTISPDDIEEDGQYPVFGGNGLRGYTTNFTHDGTHALIGRQGALCGNINYAHGKFWASEHAVVVSTLNNVETVWLGELLRAMNLNQYSVSAAQPGLSVDIIRNLFIAVPPQQEQYMISAFLDRETAKIDALVKEQRRLIELLKEKRQAVISHAVTKGLNPHVKMKPSGIEWLGDVPEHWDIVPLRFLVQFISGGTPDKKDTSYWDGTIPWVSSKDMKVAEIADAEDHVSEQAVIESGLKIIPADHIVVVVRGMILAHSFPVAITLGDITINQDLKALKCVSKLTPLFLRFVFEGITAYIVANADQSAHGTKKLETEMLGKLPILLPPVAEQNRIVAELRREMGILEGVSTSAQKAIDLMQERRTALISAAVTGKIDVRGQAGTEAA